MSDKSKVLAKWRFWRSELVAMANRGRKMSEGGRVSIADVLAKTGYAVHRNGALITEPEYEVAFDSWMSAIERI